MSAASCQVKTRPPQPQSSIDFRNCLSEREDAVIAVEVEGAHFLRSGNCAVVRVMEQQDETRHRAYAARPSSLTSFSVIPFVNDHELCAVNERRQTSASAA